MNLVDKIRHWYWMKFDVNYAIVFLCNLWIEEYVYSGSTIYAGRYYNETNTFKIRYIKNADFSNRITIVQQETPSNMLSKVKSDFIIKYFKHMFVDGVKVKSIKRDRKLSKIK